MYQDDGRSASVAAPVPPGAQVDSVARCEGEFRHRRERTPGTDIFRDCFGQSCDRVRLQGSAPGWSRVAIAPDATIFVAGPLGVASLDDSGDWTLNRLVNDSPFDAQLRADLAEADVITLLIPMAEWAEPMQTATGAEGRDPEDCGGDDNQQCMRDVIADYQALVGSVFEALTAIADPNETVIRVQDVHLFPTNASQDALDILYPFFADANEYVEKTAASYGIPVAHVFNEFAGPDGSLNAEEAGLIGPDHRHPTEDGALRIAELIRNLGYDRSTSSAAQAVE
jgi:hypothetical protein